MCESKTEMNVKREESDDSTDDKLKAQRHKTEGERQRATPDVP